MIWANAMNSGGTVFVRRSWSLKWSHDPTCWEMLISILMNNGSARNQLGHKTSQEIERKEQVSRQTNYLHLAIASGVT